SVFPWQIDARQLVVSQAERFEQVRIAEGLAVELEFVEHFGQDLMLRSLVQWQGGMHQAEVTTLSGFDNGCFAACGDGLLLVVGSVGGQREMFWWLIERQPQVQF